jgi:hypothetical protein
MRLCMEGLLYLAVGVCSVMLIVSVIAYLCAIFLVISRTGAVVDRAEERELSWGERAGRANSRFGRFFVANEFRSLRRLLFGASVGAIGSFGLLLLLIEVIGKRPLGG